MANTIPYGYYTPYGYMGYVPSEKRYMLFSTETDILDTLTQ